MNQTISKSNIKTQYLDLISGGMEDWDARKKIIDSFMTTDNTNDNYCEPGSPDYYFIISQIWSFCG
jgi:hypothetical protein